jgi:ATP-binding cassette subfamily B protein
MPGDGLRIGGIGGAERLIGGLGRGFGLGQVQFEPRERDRRTAVSGDHYRRVLGYLKPYGRQGLGILACVSVSSVFALAPPQIVRLIIDQAIPQADLTLLGLLVAAMIGLPALGGLIGVFQNFLTIRVGQGLMYDLRNALYRHLQLLSLRFYTSTRSGEIISRIGNDVAAIRDVVRNTFIGILTNFFTVITTLVVIFSMNWQLACLAVVILPTFILPTRRVGRIRQRLTAQTQEQQAELSAHMFETLHLGGFVLTQIFGREEYESERFRRINERLMGLEIRQVMAGRWFFLVLSLFGAIGPALIYWYGGYQAIQGRLTVGVIIAFVAYLANLYRPITQLASVYVEVQGAMAVFARIFEYLDLEPEVRSQPGARALPPVRGRVVFEQVSFSYDGETRALDEVSLVAEPGQLVALVGPSGAGKTTATYLVPRFYDPDGGRITIDGHDLREVELGSLRAQIGMVTQETFLFHASIRENLLYARPEATQEELVEAARGAHIHEFIEGLPQGYDTLVGERGFRLSGGEKQRLSIARAILKNPRILILDEATSSLDSASEAAIQAALAPLMKGRTSLVIAHRLSTVLSADRILVFDQGRLVEQGTHAELSGRGGLYARLCAQQFRSRTGPAAG